MEKAMIEESNAKWLARLWPFPCKTCGTPNTNSTEGKDCDECYAKSPEAIAKREAEARELAATHQRFTDSQLARIISPEIRETDIDHPDFNRRAWERIRAGWNPESTDWLWLHSKTSGRCKSRIAYLLLREQYLALIRPVVSSFGSFQNGAIPRVLWVDGDRLTEAFRTRNQYSLGESVMSEAHDLVETARTADLLVIDDLTKRKLAGEAASDGLWEVIKHRHEYRRRTIITDNYLPESLEDMLHEKLCGYIFRRLVERCIQVDFDA